MVKRNKQIDISFDIIKGLPTIGDVRKLDTQVMKLNLKDKIKTKRRKK